MNQTFSHHIYSPRNFLFCHTQDAPPIRLFRTKSKIDPDLAFGRLFCASRMTWWYDCHSSCAYSLRLQSTPLPRSRRHRLIRKPHLQSRLLHPGSLTLEILVDCMWTSKASAI